MLCYCCKSAALLLSSPLQHNNRENPTSSRPACIQFTVYPPLPGFSSMTACNAVINSTPNACAATLSRPAVLSSCAHTAHRSTVKILFAECFFIINSHFVRRTWMGYVSSAANSNPAATRAVTKNPTAPAMMNTSAILPHCTAAEKPPIDSALRAKRTREVSWKRPVESRNAPQSKTPGTPASTSVAPTHPHRLTTCAASPKRCTSTALIKVPTVSAGQQR